jgi:hypothetical protein
MSDFDRIAGLTVSLLLGAAGAQPAVAQETMGADVSCKAVQANGNTYDCTLVLKGAAEGQPIAGAAIVRLGTGKAAARGAERVQPLDAKPADRAGAYSFRVALPTEGEWVLKIRLAKPRKDLIVHKVVFDKSGG